MYSAEEILAHYANHDVSLNAKEIFESLDNIEEYLFNLMISLNNERNTLDYVDKDKLKKLHSDIDCLNKNIKERGNKICRIIDVICRVYDLTERLNNLEQGISSESEAKNV